MPELGKFPIGYALRFYATTTNPSTGAAADATGDPAYRVYEEATGTALLTGTMSKLDDPNTTGFYTASIDLTAANGFELDKDYVIYIEATVGGVLGNMHHRFSMQQAGITPTGGSGGPITFAQLIKELATLCGAVKEQGAATAGAATTLTDALLAAAYADDHYNGHRLYIYEGTARGQERIITDYTGASGLFTFASGTTPDTSSKYIVLARDWRVQELRDAIINAIRARRRFHLLPKLDETLTFDTDPDVVYEYNVPSGFVTIQHILRERNAGEADFDYEIDPTWYYIEKTATRQIVFEKLLNDRIGFIVNSCALRIIGQQYQEEPVLDSDTVSIPTGNILWLAAANAMSAHGPGDHMDAEHWRSLTNTALRRFEATQHDDVTPIRPGAHVVEDS